MELKHFRLIKTIKEEGSIALSSEKLFLTQSALSHQLRDIEEQLGFKVFYRRRNKWELTEQGEELHRVANELFKTIDEGFGKIKYINEGSKGTVRIGTECFSYYRGLPTFIQKMGILYPNILVDIQFDSTCHPVTKLVSKEIDMAISTEKTSSDKIKCIDLYSDEVFCVMNKEHKFATLPFLDPSHFTNMNLIIHSYPLESVAVYANFLKPNDTTPNKISAIPFISVALEMVQVNMGVICLPIEVIKTHKLADDLIFKKIGEHGLKRTQYLLYRTEDHTKRYIQDFIQNIQEEFEG